MTLVANGRPRVRAELAVIPLADGTVLVRGPNEGVRVRVDGLSAPTLASLLAGAASDDGPTSNGRDQAGIGALLAGLADRDMLGRPRPQAPGSAAERFFAQFDDDFESCTRRLAESRVLVVGSGGVAERVARDLREAGIGDVLFMDVPADGAPDDAPDGVAAPERGGLVDSCREAHLVVVCSPAAGRGGLESTVNAIALDHGVPWLPLRVVAGEAFVGPLFLATEGPCHRCVLTREEANWPDPALERAYVERVTHDPSTLEAYGALPPFVAIASQWAALEATRYLSRYSAPVLAGNVLHIDFVRCRMELHRVVRVPRCPECSPLVRRPRVDTMLYASRHEPRS